MSVGNWVELRYRTGRGQKKKVKVFDAYGSLDRMIEGLTKAHCTGFTFSEVKR